MLSHSADVRMPAMEPQPTYTDDPYQTLVGAIIARAVQDAQGHCASPGAQSPAQIQAEARRWLADERAVAALVELCGLDAEPVLRSIRRILATDMERRQAMTADEARQIVRGDIVRYRGREYTVQAVIAHGPAAPSFRLSGLSVRDGGTTPVSYRWCTKVERREGGEVFRRP
jgi:hypothetical protein